MDPDNNQRAWMVDILILDDPSTAQQNASDHLEINSRITNNVTKKGGVTGDGEGRVRGVLSDLVRRHANFRRGA